MEAVTLSLRGLILNGELQPGERIQEVALAQKLGVSRTPVRLALGILEGEGLVVGAPNRGFAVRGFTIDEVLAGYDVRAVLDGLACRLIAEGGLQRSVASALDQSIEVGERLLSKATIDEMSAREWSAMNDRFHSIIIKAADSAPLAAAHALNAKLPLVGAGAIAFLGGEFELAYRSMRTAQAEHVRIVKCLKQGEAARAENLMREHAYESRDNLRVVLEKHPPLGKMLSLKSIAV